MSKLLTRSVAALLILFGFALFAPAEAGSRATGKQTWREATRKIRRIIRRPRGPYMRGPFVIVVYDDEGGGDGGYQGAVYEPILELKRSFILLGDVKESDPRWPVLCLDLIEKARAQALGDPARWALVHWAAADLELRIGE
jgi:hypothetical protein